MERRLVTYDLPLTLAGPDGRMLIVQIILPTDIDVEEAERLVDMIRTLPLRTASSAPTMNVDAAPVFKLLLP